MKELVEVEGGRRHEAKVFKRIATATSVASRMRGLLGAEKGEELLLIAPCKGIHTCGMRYPIDVAFVDCEGVVVLVRRALEPGRRVACKAASLVIERRYIEDAAWFELGEEIGLVSARSCER